MSALLDGPETSRAWVGTPVFRLGPIRFEGKGVNLAGPTGVIPPVRVGVGSEVGALLAGEVTPAVV